IDAADGQILARATAPAGMSIMGFSPDGALLGVFGEKGLELRHATSLAPISNLSLGSLPRDYISLLATWAFAPDGRQIAVAGYSGKVRLWDFPRREELLALDLRAGPIHKVVFTPDGNKVRFIADKQVGELDLHAFDAYVEGNLTWNLLRLLPNLDRTEA